MNRLRLCLGSLLILVACGADATPAAIPVYISDSHAGSFYFLAGELDWESSVPLILFDAHHDFMPVWGQEGMRRELADQKGRHSALERIAGRESIQCYSWIQPLMPSPIGEVRWMIGGPRTHRAKGRTDGEAIIRRACGDRIGAYAANLGRWTSADMDSFSAARIGEGGVVVSVDLDAFSGFGFEAGCGACRRAFEEIGRIGNLRCLTIAISRNYLESDSEAWSLLQTALESLSASERYRYTFDFTRKTEREISAKADEDRLRYGEVPRFSLERAPERLRALVARLRKRT